MVTIYSDLTKEVYTALAGKAMVPSSCPIRQRAPRGSDCQVVPWRLRPLLGVWWEHKMKDRPHTKADTEQHRRYDQCIGSIKTLLDAEMCGELGVKYRGQRIRYYANWMVVVE